jgi:hypothetical protein
MFASFSFADFLIILAGFIWLLKKVAEMERYHSLRVFVLTAFLSCIVIYFFVLMTLGPPPVSDYAPDYSGADHFTLSENIEASEYPAHIFLLAKQLKPLPLNL